MARRTRRMSSSLLPLNITPQITSIQPALRLSRSSRRISLGGLCERLRCARARRRASRHAGGRTSPSRGSPTLAARSRGRDGLCVPRPRPASRTLRASPPAPRRCRLRRAARPRDVPDRRSGQPLDHEIRDGRRHLDDRVRFAHVDLADVAARDARLVRDRADDVRRTRVVARSRR